MAKENNFPSSIRTDNISGIQGIGMFKEKC